MGLGKTLTNLAFLVWVKEVKAADHHLPMLILAPTGLLKNWRAEMERHLKRGAIGEVIEAHGSGLASLRRPGLERRAELMGMAALDAVKLRAADVVLTTYEAIRDFPFSFGGVQWGVVVMDEAQKIKNPSAMMTEAVKALNAEFLIAATGTPVENRLQDLWCIGDTVAPGYLGSLKDFENKYEPAAGPMEHLEELRERVLVASSAPLMLRRMKIDHIEGLPSIEHHAIREDMPERQAAAYRQVVQGAASAKSSMTSILAVLGTIRRVALHPFDDEILTDTAFFGEAARMRVLVRVLDQVNAAGEKALVFVNSLDIQGQLLARLQRRYQMSQPPFMINGSVDGAERQRRVDQFQARSGFDVMLLSPRAGGVGLTLHAANHVIHLDRWWNPAVEDQCTDRVYRIGQKRPVHVYLPLAVHPDYKEKSFDISLNDLISRKRDLSRDLLAPAAESHADIEQLFRDTTQ
jgi:SNF2 family DNA or RNA helicase